MSKPRPKPDTYTGTTLEAWHANPEAIRWAAIDQHYRAACSVVLHELTRVTLTPVGCSGERAFGRVEGYQMALDVMRSLGQRPAKPAPEVGETYERPADALTTDLRD